MTKRKAILDIDTMLYHAALAPQVNYILVTHKASGRQKEFKGVTEFYGKGKAKDGGWLGELNAERGTSFTVDDFAVESLARLEGNGASPEAIAFGRFKNKVESVASAPWCNGEFSIAFGVGRNFRYDVAKTQPYKHGRPPKPILYEEVKEYMLSKYKKHMIVEEGVETDDVVSWLMLEDYTKAKGKPENCKLVLSYIDKDLNQVVAWGHNYNEMGDIFWKDPLFCAKSFCSQLLSGDNTDHIPGIPNIPDDLCEKWGIRRTRGVGASTANSVIEPCHTAKEAFERVVEAYRGYYNEGWKEALNERALLLKMMNKKGEMYNIFDTLTKLGIQHEE